MRIKAFTAFIVSQLLAQLIFPYTANAVSVKGLLSKDFLTNIGANAVYDVFKSLILSSLTDVNESDDLTTNTFKKLNIKTFVSSGAVSFYTDSSGNVKAIELDLKAPQINSQLVDLEVTSLVKKRKYTEKGAGYQPLAVSRASAEKTFPVLGTYIPLTGTYTELNPLTFGKKPTNETAWALAYSFAYVNENFDIKSLDGKTLPLYVPEPITILGSVAALGFGTLLKRKYSKKLEKQTVSKFR